MRRKSWLLVLALSLLCTSCISPGIGGDPGEGEYAVYYAVGPREDGSFGGRTDSAALQYEYHTLPEGSGEVEGLFALLMARPEDPELVASIPAGITLRSWSQEDGILNLDLSEAYGDLSGVELTLADSCIVLTLCQLPEVKAVYLTVEGRPRPFRDQVLSASDFLLDNMLKGESPAETESGEESEPLPSGFPEETFSPEE